MPYTQVANLDFEDIKSALKEYLRSESDFTDYGGSARNVAHHTGRSF